MAHKRHESRLSPEIQRHTYRVSGGSGGFCCEEMTVFFCIFCLIQFRLLASLEQLVDSLRAENERLRGLLAKEAGLKPIVGGVLPEVSKSEKPRLGRLSPSSQRSVRKQRFCAMHVI